MSEHYKKVELLERKLNATKRKLSALQSFPLDKLHVSPDNDLYQKGLLDPVMHYEFEILKKRNNEMVKCLSSLQQQDAQRVQNLKLSGSNEISLQEKNKKQQEEIEQLKSELKVSSNNLQDANTFINKLKQELLGCYKKCKYYESENTQLQSKLFYYQTHHGNTELLPTNQPDVSSLPMSSTDANFANLLSTFESEQDQECIGGNTPIPEKDEESVCDPVLDIEDIHDDTMEHDGSYNNLTVSTKTMDSWGGTLEEESNGSNKHENNNNNDDESFMDSPVLAYEEC